jgi:hypothetical protein
MEQSFEHAMLLQKISPNGESSCPAFTLFHCRQFFMPSISIADDESGDVKIFNGDET